MSLLNSTQTENHQEAYDYKEITEALVEWQDSMRQMISDGNFYSYSFFVDDGKVLYIQNCMQPFHFYRALGKEAPYPQPEPIDCIVPTTDGDIELECINQVSHKNFFDSITKLPEFASYSSLPFSARYICKVKALNEEYRLILVNWYRKDLDNIQFFHVFLEMCMRHLQIAWAGGIKEARRNDLSNLLIDKAFAYCLNYKSELKNLFTDVFTNSMNAISATYYESEEVAGTLQFVDNIVGYTPDILLAKPLRLSNTKLIRKLLTVANNAIIIVLNGDVIGFSNELRGHEPDIHIVKFFGHMKWAYYNRGIEQFRSIDSRIIFSSPKPAINTILGKWFPSFDERYEETITEQMRFRKGAVLIITNNAQAEANRLCSFNRGTKVNPFSIFDYTDITTGIAKIDGALILDEKGDCHSFGVILDGETIIEGSPARGARYNSTKNYIVGKNKLNNSDKYVGIVMSEDGMVDIFDPDTTTEKKNPIEEILGY